MQPRKVAFITAGLSAGFIWLSLAVAIPPSAASSSTPKASNVAGGRSGMASGPNFTSAQTDAGASVYTAQCQACHGAQLQGVSGPALAGSGFLTKWSNHPLSNLYNIISKQMPLSAPGSLSQAQYLAVTAFVLSKNKYNPTSSALDLKGVQAVLPAPSSSTASAAPIRVVPKNLPISVKTGGLASSSKPSDAEMLSPQDGDWLGYNRDYRGQRYSPLSSITAANAKSLQVKCVFQIGEVGSFQTGPVVYGGLMYLTTPRNTYAIRADTCTKVWESNYTPKDPEPQPANRGVALYDGKLFRGTTDGHLLALDAATGKVLWDTWVADSNKGYFISAVPTAADGKVYVGEAGADWGANGHVHAFDANTGKLIWTFNTIPTGTELGAETWKKGAEHGGGSIWTTQTLDPANHLLYVSIGNPAPDFNGGLRPGDNLYTDSVVALDTRTGKLAWYAQQVSHDTHDWDTAAAPIVYDHAGSKYMAVANKGGWLYWYDRATHKEIARAEISTHLNAEKPVSLAGRRDCPGILGGAEWNGPALDPQNGTLFIGSVDWCATYKIGETRYVDGSLYFGGDATFDPVKQARGWVRAFDAATAKPLWAVKMPTPMIAAVTPTAGGVLFTGDQNGDFLVMDSSSGNKLYSFRTGGAIAGGIVTYTAGPNKTQYVAAASGNASRSIWSTTGAASIFVFGLPNE